MKKFVAVLAVTGLAGVAGAQVVNGGFETGDLTGWTAGGNLGFTSVSSVYVHSGSFSFQMGPVGSPGFIEQTLALNAGDQVLLNFWLATNGDPNQQFAAILDGITLMQTGDSGPFDYTQFSIPYTVGNNNPTLRFEFQDDPAYYFLDDVSVTRVPAPGAAGLLGLGGLVAMRRRR